MPYKCVLTVKSKLENRSIVIEVSDRELTLLTHMQRKFAENRQTSPTAPTFVITSSEEI